MGEYVLLKGIKQNRWLDVPSWLVSGEAPADCLPDFNTERNELSVFRLPRAEAEMLAQRVVVALAAGRQNLDHYDYVLIDADRVEGVPIEANRTRGGTGDEQVDDLHVDLVNLTASAVAKLAAIILEVATAGELRRLHKSDVKTGIQKAVELRHLDQSNSTKLA